VELSSKLDTEIGEATEREEYEIAGLLTRLRRGMEEIADESESLTLDDVTDKKYQLEDRKRRLAQEIYDATKDKRVSQAHAEYDEVKSECELLLNASGNDYERKSFNDIVNQEAVFFSTNSPVKIKEKTDEIRQIIYQIHWRLPDFLQKTFSWLESNQSKMNNRLQSKSLLESGRSAITTKSWDRLREINYGLLDLLPRGTKSPLPNRIGFGL
jgi:molecular chaperone DnaK